MIDNRISFKVKDSCESCVTRLRGEELRKALIAELERYASSTRVTIDFEGISVMTPSFADECFGKLAEHLGKEVFTKRLRLVNASKLIRDVVNTVISQRVSKAF